MKESEKCFLKFHGLSRKGQTFIEYTLLLGILAVLMSAMTPFVRRSVQAMVKVVSDQVGNQQAAEQTFDRSGHLINSTSRMSFAQQKSEQERLGIINYIYDAEDISIRSETSSNIGFQEK